jgi:hypothetical protein
MIPRIRSLLPLLCCLACERSASRQASDSSTVAIQTAALSSRPKIEDPIFGNFETPAPDSSYGAWNQEGFLSGSHVRHPSGSLTIWLDTAIRATEEHPVGRAHADSVVVPGLRPGEGIGRFCQIDHSMADRVVGVVLDDTIFTRPRIAWLFDTTFRIRTIPTDSVTCLLREPMDEVD